MSWTIGTVNNVITFERIIAGQILQSFSLSGGQYAITYAGSSVITINTLSNSSTNATGLNFSIPYGEIGTIGGNTAPNNVSGIIAAIIAIMPTVGGSSVSVLSTALSGLNVPAPGTPITPSDTVLSAFGKLQAQINDLS